MDQMILSEPSIIIIWTYQDMMGWMSRILVGEMAGLSKCPSLSVFGFQCNLTLSPLLFADN
jgi:hypothetical protein